MSDFFSFLNRDKSAFNVQNPQLIGGFRDLDPTQRGQWDTLVAALQDVQLSAKPEFAPQIKALTTEYQSASDSLSRFVGYLKNAGFLSGTTDNASPALGTGEVQIGIVRLTVPPERITVHEMPNLLEVPGLRTDGTTVIKTGKGRLSIMLDLVFNGDAAINNELRPLIAQFRGYPYVPLVSKYITGIVQPKLQKFAPPGADKRLDEEANLTIGEITRKKLVITEKIKLLFQSYPGLEDSATSETVIVDGASVTRPSQFNEAQTNFNAISSTLIEVDRAFTKMFIELANATRRFINDRPAKVLKATQDVQTLQKTLLRNMNELKSAIMKLERIRHAKSLLEIGGLIDLEEGIIPCCLDQLQIYSVEDRPRLIRARLIVSFFNSGPFGGVLQYKDILGRPTIDPNKALYFKRYLDSTWLNEPTLIDPPGSQTFNSDPTDTLKFDRTVPILGLAAMDSNSNILNDQIKIGYADVQIENALTTAQTPNIETGVKETSTADEAIRQTRPSYQTLVLGGVGKNETDGANGVVRGLTATLSNRLAFQQVQGEFYPTAQYMGGKPAFAEVEVFCTNDDIIKRIHDMKIATQRMSTLALRQARRPEVHIRNTFLNLMGIYTAQLENVVTETVSPNTTKITLRFVEHRINLQDREKLQRATLFSRNRIKAVLKFLVELAAKHVDGRSPNEIVRIEKIKETPGDAKFVKEEREAHQFLYTKFNATATETGIEKAKRLAENLRRASPEAARQRRLRSIEASTASQDAGSSSIVTDEPPQLSAPGMDTLVYDGVLFRPSIIMHALFIKENPKGPKELQTSIRKQVLINAGFFPDTTQPTDAQLEAIIKKFGGPEKISQEIINRWGWGKTQLPKDFTNIDTLENLSAEERERIHLEKVSQLKSFPPQDMELSLLADYFVRSSGNAADEVKVVQGDNDRYRILRKDGFDKTDELQAINLLTEAIVNNQFIRPPRLAPSNAPGAAISEGQSIRKIGMGDFNVRDFLRNRRNLPSMLYPDLHLPTYRHMLQPLLEALKTSGQQSQEKGRPALIKPTFKWKSIQDPKVREPLSPAAKSLLNVFIPTFRQIGQIPDQPGLALDDFAYDLDDDMLPDFPFFGVNMSSFVNKAFETASDRSRTMPEHFNAARNEAGYLVDEKDRRREINDPLAQIRFEQLRFNQNAATESQSEQKKPKGTNIPAYGSQHNSEIQTTELYSPGFDRTTLSDIGANSEQVHRDIFEAAFNSFDDNLLTMRRCFPTFRLFFIEEDQREGVWTAIDDVYGYNSVISLNVTRHKNQPDLAEVKVTNLEGNLESDKFGISTARGGGGDSRYGKDKDRQSSRTANEADEIMEIAGPKEPGTRERALRRFPLSEGTRIMVQLGYHSNPRYMETVFTGKIAEVKMGDVVHFIAQGYLQELLFPMIANPNTEKTRGVVETVLNSPTVQHFGTWTPYSWRYLSPQERLNSRTHSILSGLGENFARFYADPKLRNVWVAQYGTWWGETLSRLFYQDKWEVGGGTKTGWDVIQDIVAYTPGYIAAVVPYDTEATLFIGRPEQAYFWTDSRQDLHSDWSRVFSKRRLKQIDISQDIERLFFQSEDYDGSVTDLMKKVSTVAAVDSTAKNKLAKDLWIDLSNSRPKWMASLEAIKTIANPAGLRQTQRGGFPLINVSTESRILKQGGIVPDLRYDEDVEKHLRSKDNATTVARDFNAAYTLLGRSADARRLILGILAGILGRSTRYLSTSAGTLNPFSTDVAKGERLEQFTARGVAKVIDAEANQLKNILGRIRNPASLFAQVWNGVDKEFHQRALATTNLITFSAVGPTDTPTEDNKARRMVYTWLTRFRATIPVAMAAIRSFIEANALALNLNVNQESIGDRSQVWPMSPRMRPFRSYHMVTSRDDILDNQMSASRGAMWNTVAISGASGPPLQIKCDDGIIKDDTQIRYFREPNADNDFQNVTAENGLGGFVNNRFLVGFTRLAQGLRNMYRGHLVLRGRPSIKPWDIIYVYDTYNMIFGPIEVERVTHHFSAETGFVTTIIPHLVCIPNNQVDSASILAEGWAYGGIALASIAGAGVLLGGGLVLLGAGAALGLAVGLGVAFGGKSIADFIFNEIAGTSLNGLLVGNGQFAGGDSPIKIFPLMRHGAPWVASIRGWGSSNPATISGFVYESVSKLGDKWEDAKFFFDRVWDKNRVIFDPDQLEDTFINDRKKN